MNFRQGRAMHPELIAAYSAPVPRYTSYPTAPYFNDKIDAGVYGRWLEQVPESESISLYLHIPFCDRLCWFCGCHTKQVRQYAPVSRYLDTLIAEIALVANRLGRRQKVRAIHYGGGSPTMLAPEDMIRLDRNLRVYFDVLPEAGISMEIDPSDIDTARLDAIAAIGVNRASLGVQDFDPQVQRAINRIQGFEVTQAAIDGLRERGIKAVNCDILYGLPHQTEAKILKTVERVIALDPDRVALFGYAHVPWMKKHQTMIAEAALPGAEARFRQARVAGNRLVLEGFAPVGMDHFARPHDPLAIAAGAGKLRRNFQGYTTDDAEILIGLGASAIGRLPQGYVQNAVATGDYTRRIYGPGLAIVRGFPVSDRDRLHAYAIERIMCDFALSRADLQARFGADAKTIFDRADRFLATHRDGLFAREGERYVVTETGKPFVRHIAAVFDAYLGGSGRHSMAV